MSDKVKDYKARRQTWIEALESGKYKQGIKRLQNRLGQFCCLGVACDLIKDQMSIGENTNGDITYNKADSQPPPKMISYFGLYYSTCKKLMEMNDHDDKSFKEIAAYLRELNTGNDWI
jgi:type II restriction/modification system DNA methylase subunit YeeA